MNLRPVTAYIVKVQLTRPGEGGEGAAGPSAIMATDCKGKCLVIVSQIYSFRVGEKEKDCEIKD